MPENKDLMTTAAGGGAGFLMLQSVHWEAIPYGMGEPAKVIVALLLIVLSYFAYRKRGPIAPPPANP